jgi:NTP pyrophosphatase (non-canonical NTP hydrolase)
MFNILNKLMEECGELTQIAAKKNAYPNTDEHPDRKGSMKERLENEIADVVAACNFAIEAYCLDEERIVERTDVKFKLFELWDSENDTSHGS